MLSDKICSIPFRRIVWLVPITFAVHEAEEWNIMQWWVAQFSNATVVSDVALRTFLVGITAAAFLWTAIASLLPAVRATAYMVLPVFVIGILGNSLQHIYWQLVFQGYAPGFLSSMLLIIPSILLVSWHALRNQLVGLRFLGIIYASLIPLLVVTIRGGRTEPPPFHEILTFSVWMARLLFGAI